MHKIAHVQNWDMRMNSSDGVFMFPNKFTSTFCREAEIGSEADVCY